MRWIMFVVLVYEFEYGFGLSAWTRTRIAGISKQTMDNFVQLNATNEEVLLTRTFAIKTIRTEEVTQWDKKREEREREKETEKKNIVRYEFFG